MRSSARAHSASVPISPGIPIETPVRLRRRHRAVVGAAQAVAVAGQQRDLGAAVVTTLERDHVGLGRGVVAVDRRSPGCR